MMDQDALTAGVDLIGRTGATEFEVGYLHDGPVEEAGWWAHAKYRGARVTAEDHRGPVEATEALARRLLDGGTCAHCGCLIALDDDTAGSCRWRRMADRWERGCKGSVDEGDRALVVGERGKPWTARPAPNRAARRRGGR